MVMVEVGSSFQTKRYLSDAANSTGTDLLSAGTVLFSDTKTVLHPIIRNTKALMSVKLSVYLFLTNSFSTI
jgi:hypothetical protein